MSFQKKDFIEIEFTGKVKDGEVFDSNVREDLEKLNPNTKAKPFIFSLGEGMFLQGVDEFLIGKEKGRYTIELSPENAFGARRKEFVQTIPMRIFKTQNVRPYPGAVFNFDGKMAKILSVSGGRVIADFNHPLAGKTLIYEINVLRKVDDQNEKIKSFIEFLFRKDLKFSVSENKLIIEAEKQMKKFIELFSEKFKDIFNLELDVSEIPSEENKN